MTTRAVLKLAWRSLGRNRRRSAITAGAIAFGLALAVFFFSFANGVYAQLVDDAARMHGGHLTIERREYLDAPAVDLYVQDIAALRAKVQMVAGVKRTKALILGQGVAQSGNGAAGVALAGVEPQIEAATSPIARRMTSGSYLADTDDRQAVIGARLAEQLKLEPGKKLVVSTNDASGQLVEELLRVKGIFSTGTDEVDAHFVQVPIAFARRLYGLSPDAATEIGVLLTDADKEDSVRSKIAAMLTWPLAVRTWQEVLPDLAAYIRIDGGSNAIFQGILIFLSLFTIFNTITMSVLERTREFALQLALGTPPAALRLQILFESALLAAIGCAAGLLIGGLAGYVMQVHGLDIRSFYKSGVSVSGFAIDTVVHAQVRLRTLATLGVTVVLATVLISLIPLRSIARIHVAEAIR